MLYYFHKQKSSVMCHKQKVTMKTKWCYYVAPEGPEPEAHSRRENGENWKVAGELLEIYWHRMKPFPLRKQKDWKITEKEAILSVWFSVICYHVHRLPESSA